jgi:hypothetical protein
MLVSRVCLVTRLPVLRMRISMTCHSVGVRRIGRRVRHGSVALRAARSMTMSPRWTAVAVVWGEAAGEGSDAGEELFDGEGFRT